MEQGMYFSIQCIETQVQFKKNKYVLLHKTPCKITLTFQNDPRKYQSK